MSRTIRITVAETSEVIRTGIVAVLAKVPGLRLEVHEVSEVEKLRDQLIRDKPHILVINPSMLDVFSLQKIRKEVAHREMKCAALEFSVPDPAVARLYDMELSIYDSGEQMCEKIGRLVSEPRTEPQHEPLSIREKEVVACVVQGLTNRQTAEKLCLSTHTVIAHRRNISAKLNIHSTAGLAIYAIVNKLVELSDIKAQE